MHNCNRAARTDASMPKDREEQLLPFEDVPRPTNDNSEENDPYELEEPSLKLGLPPGESSIDDDEDVFVFDRNAVNANYSWQQCIGVFLAIFMVVLLAASAYGAGAHVCSGRNQTIGLSSGRL